MGTEVMGKVTVSAVIENLDDYLEARRGTLPAERVRHATVTDALVDSGATMLLLPSRMITELGLKPLRTQTARTANGTVQMQLHRAVRLSVQGRDCILDVGEVSDDLPVIIGQLPLEAMDWHIDMRGHRLIGNPEFGGVQMMDVL